MFAAAAASFGMLTADVVTGSKAEWVDFDADRGVAIYLPDDEDADTHEHAATSQHEAREPEPADVTGVGAKPAGHEVIERLLDRLREEATLTFPANSPLSFDNPVIAEVNGVEIRAVDLDSALYTNPQIQQSLSPQVADLIVGLFRTSVQSQVIDMEVAYQAAEDLGVPFVGTRAGVAQAAQHADAHPEQERAPQDADAGAHPRDGEDVRRAEVEESHQRELDDAVPQRDQRAGVRRLGPFAHHCSGHRSRRHHPRQRYPHCLGQEDDQRHTCLHPIVRHIIREDNVRVKW